MPSFTARPGLHRKTLFALLALNGSTLLVAFLLGSLMLDDLRLELSESFARSRAQYSQQLISGKLQPELLLARRLADSIVTRRWLQAVDDPQARAHFFEEAEGYRRSFASRAYFIVPERTREFHHNDDNATFSPLPRYRLDESRNEDAWYFSTLRQADEYNVNVNPDRALQTTRVWFNVPVRDASGQVLGVAGSGLALGDFLQQFIRNNPPGITAMIVDPLGRIQAHPDPAMIEYSSVSKAAGEKTLQRQLGSDAERTRLTQALQDVVSGREAVASFSGHLDGRPQLFALAHLPELHWVVVSAVDLQTYTVLDSQRIQGAAAFGVVLILLLLSLTLTGFGRIVLRPLTRLTQSVREVAAGAYDVRLHSTRQDEIGELTRNFDQMAQNILDHTRHLEARVEERTRALLEAHRRIDDAHRQLTESIECASHFQRALLPTPQILADFPGELEALWRPRDVVGGDLYVYRPLEDGALLVVMDCAGHGVPGALMTMIAHATLDVALASHPASDPAGLMAVYDRCLRLMLPARQRFGQLTSDMDLAFCHFDFARQQLTYAGARLALHCLEAGEVRTIAASRRNVGGNKPVACENSVIPLHPGMSAYLCSDGLPDQNGGPQGHAFGDTAFREALQATAGAPPAAVLATLERQLDAYRGELPQRDDITVVAFRWRGR